MNSNVTLSQMGKGYSISSYREFLLVAVYLIDGINDEH